MQIVAASCWLHLRIGDQRLETMRHREAIGFCQQAGECRRAIVVTVAMYSMPVVGLIALLALADYAMWAPWRWGAA